MQGIIKFVKFALKKLLGTNSNRDFHISKMIRYEK